MGHQNRYKVDLPKLKEVVYYICSQCNTQELGNVKLHKILYFSDMLHYLSTKKPLTGVEYQKQSFGPVARHLTWAINELCKDGAIRVKKRDYFGFQKTDYEPLQKSISFRLSNFEIQLLNDVIEFVCERSAKEISELSHRDPWDAAEMGETIPYYSAYGLVPTEASEDDIADAIAEARAIRPSIEREMHDRGIQ